MQYELLLSSSDLFAVVMADLTPVITQIVTTYIDGYGYSTKAHVGEIPVSYYSYSTFTASAWAALSSAAPASLLSEAAGLEQMLWSLYAETDEYGKVTASWYSELDPEVTEYFATCFSSGIPTPTPTTVWYDHRMAEYAPTVTMTSTSIATLAQMYMQTKLDEARAKKLKVAAITVPICLIFAFLILGFVLWWNRRRIVEHLHRKYNGPDFNAPPLGPHEVKRWSGDTFTPDFASPRSPVSPVDHPVRAHGTPNFPGPRQHLAEKARCETPDTPLSRKEQLENRSRSIQELHARVTTPTPGIEIDEANEIESEREPASNPPRPTSPTGSIRLVESHEPPKRSASHNIVRRLDEVFQPDWTPEKEKRLPTA